MWDTTYILQLIRITWILRKGTVRRTLYTILNRRICFWLFFVFYFLWRSGFYVFKNPFWDVPPPSVDYRWRPEGVSFVVSREPLLLLRLSLHPRRPTPPGGRSRRGGRDGSSEDWVRARNVRVWWWFKWVTIFISKTRVIYGLLEYRGPCLVTRPVPGAL